MTKARAPKRRVYGGRSSEERREERRERLLAAGLKLFGTRGYARTSIEQLCSTAKVTARHFYEEFASREALLVAVYDGIVGHAREAVARNLAVAPDDPEERVARGLSAFVHAYLDDPRYVRVACLEVVGVSTALEKHRRGVIREFGAIIAMQADVLAARGVIEKRDFRLLGIALAGATNELLIEWVLSDPHPAPETLVDELVRLYAGSGAAPPVTVKPALVAR